MRRNNVAPTLMSEIVSAQSVSLDSSLMVEALGGTPDSIRVLRGPGRRGGCGIPGSAGFVSSGLAGRAPSSTCIVCFVDGMVVKGKTKSEASFSDTMPWDCKISASCLRHQTNSVRLVTTWWSILDDELGIRFIHRIKGSHTSSVMAPH